MILSNVLSGWNILPARIVAATVVLYLLPGFQADSQAAMTFQYTFSDGQISGTLGGTPFNDANFTITAVGNTADIQFLPVFLGFPTYFLEVSNPTIAIQGFSPTVMLGDWALISTNYGEASDPQDLKFIGLVELNDAEFQGIFFVDSTFYDLASAFTTTGESNFDTCGCPINTPLGGLSITSASESVGFSAMPASVPTPVPLPPSLWLVVSAALPLLGFRFRQTGGRT